MTSALDREALRLILSKHEPSVPVELIPGIVRREAGVLVPIRVSRTPSVILTARSSVLRDHAGEVCFPGGKPHPEDKDLAATALREAHEELGIAPELVELAGVLSPIPTATSTYRLHPIVGLLPEQLPPWSLSNEVARVVELPFESFVNGRVGHFHTLFSWRGAEHPTPFFQVDEQTVIYGATAYVLAELLSVLAPLGITLPTPTLVDQPAWALPLIERFRAIEAKAREQRR